MSIMPAGGWGDSPSQVTQEEPIGNTKSGLVFAGYLCCIIALFFLPPAFALAGFVVGVVALAKERVGHGIALIVLSVVSGLAGMYIGAHAVVDHWGQRLLARIEHSHVTPLDHKGSNAPARFNHAIGETVSVGYWTYRCNGAQWMSSLGSDFGSVEQPDAAYLVVDLTIRNDDRTASTRPPMKLIDTQGREFSESSKEYILDREIDDLKELNPGVSTRGYILFDVPPEGKYQLEVSGGFESDEYRFIDIPKVQLQKNGDDPTETEDTTF